MVRIFAWLRMRCHWWCSAWFGDGGALPCNVEAACGFCSIRAGDLLDLGVIVPDLLFIFVTMRGGLSAMLARSVGCCGLCNSLLEDLGLVDSLRLVLEEVDVRAVGDEVVMGSGASELGLSIM